MESTSHRQLHDFASQFYVESMPANPYAHGIGCVTPVSANVASLSSAQLAAGQLPNMQQLPQIRDPEWLKVEVCREFQRGACKRTADECRYAHPEKNIQIAPDGKVIACFDALKGRCNRESCKYLHPTYQLKQQLEITGRQTLLQNRAMLQQMLPLQQNVVQASALPQSAGLISYEQMTGGSGAHMVNSLHSSLYNHNIAAPTAAAGTPTYSVLPSAAELSSLNQHYMTYYPVAASPSHHQLALAQHAASQQMAAAMLPSAGAFRADKLEVCRDFQRGNCTRGEYECRYCHPPDRSMIDVTDNTVTVCMDCIKGRCTREKCKYFHPPTHLQAKIRAAQNPGAAAFLPSLTPQPTVMAPKRVLTLEDVMTNGSGIGQPPLKRHALESSIITSSASGLGSSPGLAPSPTSSQNAATLAALYGYSNAAALQGLATLPHQSLHSPTAYYQQAASFPMLQLAGPGAAQSAQLTAFSLPSTSASAPGGSAAAAASYALLNGQTSQLSAEYATAKAQMSNQQQQHQSQQQQQQSAGGATSMTVCRDYQSGKCVRPYCRFVHVREDYVEIKDDKVTVCRNALQGRCTRHQCKFYHLPSNPTSPAEGRSIMDGHPLAAFATVDAPAGQSVSALGHPSLMGVLSGGILPTLPHGYPNGLADPSGV